MSNKNCHLHIAICDDGYRLSTSSGEASYTLDGIPTLKMGIVDNLPDKLTITDRRSLPSALNVSAASTLWGAKVEWEWPKEADSSWYAVVISEYYDGDETARQTGGAKFPECTYQVRDVPAGKLINLTVTLHDGKGKCSKPSQLSVKSSDNASAILCNAFNIIGGQAFIKKGVIGHYRQSQFGSFHCNNGEIKYCAGNSDHDVRMRVGVNTGKSSVADKLHDIVSKYLTGEGAEHVNELVDELKSVIQKESDYTRLTTLISEQVRQRIKAESLPGGLLHGR